MWFLKPELLWSYRFPPSVLMTTVRRESKLPKLSSMLMIRILFSLFELFLGHWRKEKETIQTDGLIINRIWPPRSVARQKLLQIIPSALFPGWCRQKHISGVCVVKVRLLRETKTAVSMRCVKSYPRGQELIELIVINMWRNPTAMLSCSPFQTHW